MTHSTVVAVNDLSLIRLHGHVDRCDAEVVSDWIADLADVGKHLTVKVLIDGKEVCSGVADRYREDLAKHTGLAGTQHAYRIALPQELRDGRAHEVTVIEAESKYELTGSPKKVEFLNSKPSPPAHLDVALVGKDGWLFLCQDSNGCIEQYMGLLRLSSEMLAEHTRDYQSRQDMLRARGIAYLIAVAPGKEYVYPEFLPRSVKPRVKKTVLTQFVSAVGPVLDEPVIQLVDNLKANKTLGQLCYKRDSHWNYLGAMVASAQIIERARAIFPNIPRFDQSMFHVKWGAESAGDLVEKVRLNYVGGAYLKAPAINLTVAADCAVGIEYEATAKEIVEHAYKDLSKTRQTRLFRNKQSKELPRAMVIRDSYADWMIPYLSEHFSEFLFIWTRLIDEEVLESFKPDVLIEEVVDRFLIKNRAVARAAARPDVP